MKIEVFLRHCYSSPNQALPNRKRPPWFNKGKILQNLKRTINPELAKINIVYDEHFGSISDVAHLVLERLLIMNLSLSMVMVNRHVLSLISDTI